MMLEASATEQPPARTNAFAETVVERTVGWPSLRLRELWQARELVYFLAWRDVKVRYKQTALGVAWAVLQPLLTVVVFTLFFNRVAKITTGAIPYPVFSLSGLVPWLFFSNAVTFSSSSLVASANLLTKIYFPRLAIPLGTTLSGTPDFLIGLALLLIVMPFYGVTPALSTLAVPAVFLLVFAVSLGVSLWLSALNAVYRDVRYVLPIMMQLWLLATPIAYPVSDLHGPWKIILGLNPMAGVVEAMRWAVLGGAAPPAGLLATSTGVTLLLLVTGTYYFRTMERRFADVI
jgi:lipopolysaccharide transport system permease protein